MTKKEKKAIRDKEYALKHKERKAEYDKEYLEKNREKRRMQGKAWYEANKQLVSEARKKERIENPSLIKQQYQKNKEYYKLYNFNNKEQNKDAAFKRYYKISLADYNEMLKEQNECCKICKRHKSEFKRALAVDHDHTTGKVRGLLCDVHNRGLGYFQDNIKTLQEAIEYLKLNSNDINTELLN